MRRRTFGMWRQWIVLAVCLAVSGWAQAQSQGDWVLARWQNGEYWFPGVVASRTADSVMLELIPELPTAAETRYQPWACHEPLNQGTLTLSAAEQQTRHSGAVPLEGRQPVVCRPHQRDQRRRRDAVYRL